MITEVAIIWVDVDTHTKTKEVLYQVDANSITHAKMVVMKAALNSPMADHYDMLAALAGKELSDPRTNFIINVDLPDEVSDNVPHQLREEEDMSTDVFVVGTSHVSSGDVTGTQHSGGSEVGVCLQLTQCNRRTGKFNTVRLSKAEAVELAAQVNKWATS